MILPADYPVELKLETVVGEVADIEEVTVSENLDAELEYAFPEPRTECKLSVLYHYIPIVLGRLYYIEFRIALGKEVPWSALYVEYDPGFP